MSVPIKLTVALPCYNEAENIQNIAEVLLPAIRSLGMPFEILVVDDGSTDDTVARAERLALPELRIVRHGTNQGLGAGIRTIFREAKGELLVTLDADLTFAPSDIGTLLSRYKKNDVDFVIGSHGLAGYSADIPRWRVVISRLANLTYSALAGQRVYGISSIFRLYRTDIVRTLPVTTSGFETPVETFFRLVSAGYRFAEVPTPLGQREFGSSKLRYGREMRRHARLIAQILVGGMRPAVSRRERLSWWVPGVIVAVCVGIIGVLPNIVIPSTLVRDGVGLEWYAPHSLDSPTLDELMSYGSRLRESIDGHVADGDPYLLEYKNKPTLWGNLFLTSVLGAAGRLLGVRNPTAIFLVGDALFPALVVFILYGLFRRLLSNSAVSMAGAVVLFLFPNVSTIRYGLPEWSLAGVWHVVERMFHAEFTRLPVPSPGMAFFFGYLWALVACLRARAGHPIRWVAAGLLLGLTLHVYFYYGVVAWILTLLLGLVLLVTRQWQRLRRLAIVVMCGAVVLVPYMLHAYQVLQLPNSEELRARLGLELGRAPFVSPTAVGIVLFLTVTIGVLAYRLHRRTEAALLLATVWTTLVVVNLQVVMGFAVQPDHWGSRTNVFLYALGLVTAASWALQVMRPKLVRAVGIGTFLFFVGCGIVLHIQNAWLTAHDYTLSPEVQAAYRFIDTELPRDSVIVSPSTRTTARIPFYTHANVYVPPACYTLAGYDEIRDRFIETTTAFGVPRAMYESALLGGADWLQNPIRARELDPAYMLWCDTYATTAGGSYVTGFNRSIPDAVLEDLWSRYDASLAAGEPATLRFRYRADYLFVGPEERLLSRRSVDRFSNLTLRYENNLVRIYEIRP